MFLLWGPNDLIVGTFLYMVVVVVGSAGSGGVCKSSVSCTRNDTFLSQAMPEPGLARARPWVELWEGLGCPWESFGEVFGYKKAPAGTCLDVQSYKK